MYKVISKLFICLLATCSFNVQANLITNGDFSSGLDSWTTFTEANGVINAGVDTFDTNGDSTSSSAASFGVGEVSFTGTYTGGGISQTFNSDAGMFDIGLDIAVLGGNLDNASGGLFSLFLDDMLVDSFDFGSVSAGLTERSSLFGSLDLTSGLHTLSVLIQRPFITSLNTPFQFLDDVFVEQVGVSTVPVPAAAWLFGTALLGFAGFSRKNKKA